MRSFLAATVLFAVLAGAALADVPFDRWAEREAIVPHGRVDGATGTCSIVYYNICSGWYWRYSPFRGDERIAGDHAGVVFDLPNDCAKEPGAECVHLGFWWYWRYTTPGWGYTLSYYLWPVDEDFCMVGEPIGSLLCQDPTERWNHYPGLGTTNADMVAVISVFDKGGLPHWCLDNNYRNSQAPIACDGWPGPLGVHSVYWGNYDTMYCPPYFFADPVGPIQFIMDATFSCEGTPIEPASWGTIKSLFR
ncbi:MAG: hypothetical protein ABIH26_00820 [Candidatus Eisenbacteria bacterium]